MSATLRTITSLVTVSVLVMGASAVPGSAIGTDASTPHDGAPPSPHVFVIIGENTALSQLTMKTAPYLMNTLKPSSAWITNDYSFPVDGSLANYIGMTSGQYIPCEVHNMLPESCHQDVPNVFQQLGAAGSSWKVWTESATGPCDFFDSGMDWTKNVYSAHHNPAVYYDGIEGGVYDEAITPKQACLRNVLPTGSTAPNDTSALDSALASGTVGNLNVIVPNDCENGHDPCGTNNPFGQFDTFLRREIPKIEASPAFGSDGVIYVTYDEGADKPYPNRFNILLDVIGPGVHPGVYGGTANLSHYSLLRAIEDGFGLPYLGGAASAQPLPRVFG